MTRMMSGYSLGLEAVSDLDLRASSAASDAAAVVDASVAEGAADAVAVADVADAADVDAAVVNQQLKIQRDPCMSPCRGLSLYIRDKLAVIR